MADLLIPGAGLVQDAQNSSYVLVPGAGMVEQGATPTTNAQPPRTMHQFKLRWRAE